jgi:hypothetical protein
MEVSVSSSKSCSYAAIDNFLDDFESFRSYCDSVNYGGLENPVDGVFYPDVSTDIPDAIRAEIIEKASAFFGAEIDAGAMFLRLSTKGVDAPHQAHSDSSMGDYALMLYLNRMEDCLGGTSFVVHKKTGLCENPINKKQELVWQESTNKPDDWSILDICSMKPNRCMFLETNYMHRAEPIGGFGSDAVDGRLVLTFFFNLL